MSCNYAEGLSPYENKGSVGMPELSDSQQEIEDKSIRLANLLRQSSWTVFHTGAGISTSCGIPDFRGPNGVWTLESKGLKPTTNVCFDSAQPSFTHKSLMRMHIAGLLQFIVNQNIDGLHLKVGLPREKVADMHGNVFVEQCNRCRKQCIVDSCVPTVGLKPTGNMCPIGSDSAGRLKCRGKMKDTILDWEDDLPQKELDLAEYHSKNAQLSVCLGTSLQIYPCRNLPRLTKKNGGQLVIVNLQKTPLDKICDVRIFGKVDEVMEIVCRELNLDSVSVLKSKNDDVTIDRAK